MEFQLSYFKSWKMMLWKCCTQYARKFGKLSSGHRTGKVSFHSNPKERQCKRMLKLPHNFTHLTWSTPKSDWLYSLQPKMEKLYTVNKNKTRSWLWLRSWAPYCQIRLHLKKVEKTTRPFRYDLNQIPYDYAQNSPSQALAIRELWTSWCSSWF